MAEENTVDGKSTTPTAEEAAAAAAKVVADAAEAKAKQDAALLDENGNPKADASGTDDGSGEGDLEDKGDLDTKSDETPADQKKLEESMGKKAKQVEDLIKDAGVDPAELLEAADPQTGELSVADKAKLVTKHGEAIADLIEGNIGKIINDIRTISTAKDSAVYKQLETEFKGVTEQSGKDTWKELSGWVKENVDVETRKAYNDMLNKGGYTASLAVKEMIASFKKREGVTIEADLLEGDGDRTVTTGGSITRAEYNKQLDMLLAKGHDYNSSPEVAALNKKRTKSMKMGI